MQTMCRVPLQPSVMNSEVFGRIFRLHPGKIPAITGAQPATWRLPKQSRKATLACFYKPVSVVLSLGPPGPVDTRMRHGAANREHAFELKILFFRHASQHNNAVSSPPPSGRKCVPCRGGFPLSTCFRATSQFPGSRPARESVPNVKRRSA